MKKSGVVDYSTLKNYCQAQAEEFDKLHDEFVDMLQQVLHRKTLKDYEYKMRDKKRGLDDFIDVIANSQNLTFSPEDLQKNIKKVDSFVGSAKRIHKETKQYYQREGENDQKIIKEITDRIEARHKKFTDEWQGIVKQALAQKNYRAAAEIVVTLPFYSTYVGADSGHRRQVFFAGSPALGEKNKEINEWVEQTKKALPKEAMLQAEINYLTDLLPGFYKEIAGLASELMKTMEKGASCDEAGLLSSYEEKRRVENLIEEISKRNYARESKTSDLRSAKCELESLEKKSQRGDYERD